MESSSNPLVTIVTVCYNSVSSIEETIISVINQTYSNLEYIIIDGGSTDGTTDIIKKYSEYISIWVSEHDNGIYDAMNKAILLAKGKWINFMNSGDTFHHNDVIKEIFQKSNYNKVGVIYGITNLVYSDFTQLQYPNELTRTNYMPFIHQSSFVDADLMRKYKFDLNLKICADRNLFYKLYSNKILFAYRDIIISNYEVQYGISSVNYPLLLKEIGIIEEKSNNIFWLIHSAFLITRWKLAKKLPYLKIFYRYLFSK